MLLRCAPALLVALLEATGATSTHPQDALFLLNGDRISGRIVAQGSKRIRIQTPYGMLVVPRSDVARILGADGREEVLSSLPQTPPEPLPPEPPPLVSFNLVIRGVSFWQAWRSGSAPADPSLRLVLRLDERDVVAWCDPALDEGEIEGAVVNTFSFEPGTLVTRVLVDGVSAPAAITSPGRIVLGLEVPASLSGHRRVGVAYQVCEETGEWRDLVWTVGSIDLASDRTAHLTLIQERGSMEFSGLGRRRMKNVDTFRLALGTE